MQTTWAWEHVESLCRLDSTTIFNELGNWGKQSQNKSNKSRKSCRRDDDGLVWVPNAFITYVTKQNAWWMEGVHFLPI